MHQLEVGFTWARVLSHEGIPPVMQSADGGFPPPFNCYNIYNLHRQSGCVAVG